MSPTEVSCEEILRRTRTFKLAQMKREAERGLKRKRESRDEEVRRATLEVIAQENARVLGWCDGTLDEFESESSESVDDESSDDEMGTSTVRDILRAGDERRTPVVRQQSRNVKSEVGIVVMPRDKESWKGWLRRVLCVLGENARNGNKLRKTRN